MNQKRLLLSPLTSPTFNLRNRIVMAPMNRRRSANGIPGPSMVAYYAQRASAGLIITDNTGILPNAFGYPGTPSIFNQAQQDGWKQVADAVHARGGSIFMQLVHTGRIGHHLNHIGHLPLSAPSAIAATETILTPGDIHLPMPQPEALTIDGIRDIIAAFATAARTAIQAGFDGVEIHGAHGFLADQFLNPHSNGRTDEYGQTIPGRSRFLLETVQAVVSAIGAERTAVRLSPFGAFNDMAPYEEEADTHRHLVDQLNDLRIAYIHLSANTPGPHSSIPEDFIREIRSRFNQLLILAGGHTPDTAEAALQAGLVDLVAFGKPFIANPDLVERIRHNAPLAVPDQQTFYHGGDQGYIDYPIAFTESAA